MKFGFTAMMSKQKPSLCNGSQKRHPHPIKHSKFGPLWKWCFNCEGVIHNELFYLVARRWTRNIIWRWWKRLSGNEEKKARCGVGKSGCSIMTTLRLIPLFWFVIFSPDMRRRSSPSLRPLQNSHQWILSLHHAEIRPERATFWVLSRRLKKIRWQSYAVFQNRHSRNVSKTEINAGSDV